MLNTLLVICLCNLCGIRITKEEHKDWGNDYPKLAYHIYKEYFIQ
ncbi:hypothetical protein HMPREF6745_2620 [Prevotella sp. oral taxon 472 str. F0295]|nr:hypothetical protein HMPREF6745_2620 [Prevotella sp. oral taxon 472 str. F0295]